MRVITQYSIQDYKRNSSNEYFCMSGFNLREMCGALSDSDRAVSCHISKTVVQNTK